MPTRWFRLPSRVRSRSVSRRWGASSSCTNTRARATAGSGRRPRRTSSNASIHSFVAMSYGGEHEQVARVTRWCVLCGAEYVAGVLECADCLVPLSDRQPLRLEELGGDDDEQVEYDFEELE